ncbi:hypothetical protein CLOHYLEM_07775 [[Clostridium] hylemonae DSM 15053]|uniref:Uncharacterized protein n=1 Tax=[Clostridium] hylemonae DSM 15053 TaxID=553973 RepID=C0C6N6_9FIRM|nr:hypothetical protein CLOHYLEM_07775 [[Clostridium] hylemonae DSM 15053]
MNIYINIYINYVIICKLLSVQKALPLHKHLPNVIFRFLC